MRNGRLKDAYGTLKGRLLDAYSEGCFRQLILLQPLANLIRIRMIT